MARGVTEIQMFSTDIPYLTLKGFDWKECRFVSETQIVSTFSANQQKYKKLMCFIMIQHF